MGGPHDLPALPGRRLLRRAAGRRARRAGHRHPRQRRPAARQAGDPLPAQDAAGAARDGAAGHGRQPRPGHRRPLPLAPVRRGHRALPQGRAEDQGAARARHPARARGLPVGGPAPEKWLREPDVGLALDPEWHTPGVVPGTQIGSTNANDVNAGLALAGGHRARAATCRRSCSSCTSSRPTWSPTSRPSSARASSRVTMNVDGFGNRANKVAEVPPVHARRRALQRRLQALLQGGRRADEARRSSSGSRRRRTSSSTSSYSAASLLMTAIVAPEAIGVALLDGELGDRARLVGGDLVLHLHRLDDADELALLDGLALLDDDLPHVALQRRGELVGARPPPPPDLRSPRAAASAARRRRRRAVAAPPANGGADDLDVELAPGDLDGVALLDASPRRRPSASAALRTRASSATSCPRSGRGRSRRWPTARSAAAPCGTGSAS